MFSGYFWVVELQIIFMILLPCILHFLNVLTKKKKKKIHYYDNQKSKKCIFYEILLWNWQFDLLPFPDNIFALSQEAAFH